MKIILIIAGIFLLLNLVYFIRHRQRGNKGLEQWPNPHGHYYEKWMALKGEHENYYKWLAKQMENKEPWKSWAEKE